jgi:hypothetical protein
VKIGDVYELYLNAQSSSAIDNKGFPMSRGTADQDRSSSDGGYLIGRRRSDHAKVFVATSHSFNPGSNVTDASDSKAEKHPLQSTSTDFGTIIDAKAFIANADSSIRRFVAISSPIQM